MYVCVCDPVRWFPGMVHVLKFSWIFCGCFPELNFGSFVAEFLGLNFRASSFNRVADQ